jgi:hypothetical protein
MLWPPPQTVAARAVGVCVPRHRRLARVGHVPLLRIDEKAGHCTRSGHVSGRRTMRFLEASTCRAA